jgi:CheY-like chemotaxis protein
MTTVVKGLLRDLGYTFVASTDWRALQILASGFNIVLRSIR